MELSSNFLKINFPVELTSFTSQEYNWVVFNPWLLIPFSVLWYTARTILNKIAAKHAGRICTVLHAFTAVFLGIPTFLVVSKNLELTFSFHELLLNISLSQTAQIFANIMGLTSVSYFIVDSFYVLGSYRKHHIAAIFAWVLTLYHDDHSKIHSVNILACFELGAIFVQFSKSFPNNLIYRTLFCVGYTVSRILLSYYYAVILYGSYASLNRPDCTLGAQIAVPVINVCLLYLLYINYTWTYKQWVLLIKFYNANQATRATVTDFFGAHQVIIGNSTSKLSESGKKLD